MVAVKARVGGRRRRRTRRLHVRVDEFVKLEWRSRRAFDLRYRLFLKRAKRERGARLFWNDSDPAEKRRPPGRVTLLASTGSPSRKLGTQKPTLVLAPRSTCMLIGREDAPAATRESKKYPLYRSQCLRLWSMHWSQTESSCSESALPMNAVCIDDDVLSADAGLTERLTG